MTRLTQYNPVIYRNNIFDLVDSFFNDQAKIQTTLDSDKTFIPRVDVIEHSDSYHFHVMVAGVNKEDIKVTVDDGTLRISGERKHITESDDVKLHRIESTYGSFERRFRLPEDANEEGLSATYENGVLTIKVEKQEKRVARDIQIL